MRSAVASNSEHVSAVKKHKKDSRLFNQPAQALITSRIGNAGDSEIPATNHPQNDLGGGEGMGLEKVKKEIFTLSVGVEVIVIIIFLFAR